VHNVPNSEIDALHDLYDSTNGNHWAWFGTRNRWNFTAPNPCTGPWQGITCSQSASPGFVHVLQLKLPRYKLTGSLPYSIANLTQLQVLNLGYNSLRSSIPESMGSFSELQRLDLNNNQLTGAVPKSLGQAVQLAELDLSTNRLRGTIPDSLGYLARLSTLNLNVNSVTGTIPGSLGNLTRLTELAVGQNGLSGSIPNSLGQLVQLTVLHLYGNQLTGIIPSGLGVLALLSELTVYSNHLSGTIPESLGQLIRLTVLSLHDNQLAGTIPGSLGNLTQLSELALYKNNLSGGIPDSFEQLTMLTALNLFGNQLTGTIPRSLGQMQQLTEFQLYSNNLDGTIPDSQLTQLEGLLLWGNQLTGTMPSSLGQLDQLTVLALNLNRLRGNIPHSVGQLAQLIRLSVWGNQLTGTIPSSVGNLTQLTYLYLDDNNLNGSIPSSFGQLRYLQVLDLEDNKLTGVFPTALAACKKLTDLNADHNKLSGTVPEFVFQLPVLRRVSFQSNCLTGTLPEQALQGTAPHLQVLLCDNNMLTGNLPNSTAVALPFLQLGLGNNRFSGTIPSNLTAALHLVDFLFLDNNQLTGTIPQNWSATASTLSYLYLQGNHLSGPIPDSLGDMPLLLSLNLSSNRLTGTVPASFQNLSSLQVLMLHNNQLRGNIAVLFSPSQTNLSTVQLSSNRLTGALPDAAFLLPSLSSFAAVDNCFEGPLPEEAICSSISLSALVLDGLHSASLCEDGASLSHQAFKIGTLPECLLSMSSLETLHLSGSGLTGSLPAKTNVSTVLTDLSLSHNLLTGKIPDGVLNRDWKKLDLSYNRLTGTLHSARVAPYCNTTELHLQHNRLSGVIPGSVQRVGRLTLLQNNMFSCRVDRSDVPQQDSASSKYTCGTDAVNSSLYAWSGAVVVVTAAASIAVYILQCADGFWVWSRAVRDAKLREVPDLFQAAHTLYVVGTGSAAYCVLVLLPVYAAVNSYHPSFTYEYAWTVSGIFLTGTAAFALVAVFLLLHLLMCVYVAERLGLRDGPQVLRGTAAANPHAPKTRLHKSSARHTLAAAAVMLLSLVVVAGANVSFVIATLNLNGRQLTAIQVLLAVFKLGFNNFVVPELENHVRTLGIGHGVSASQLLLVLLNVIVIPCLVVMVISPACFYDALKGTDSVTSSYEYSGDCLSIISVTDPSTGSPTLTCAGAQTAVDSTKYTPPFAYSYQCSSSFVTSYAPTFVIMCIISGFVLPVQRLLLLWLRETLSSTSCLYTVVTAAASQLLREPRSPQDLTQARSNSLYRPVFDARNLVMSLLTYLALLLTFGALFPPLAVCCAVAMASVALTARLEVGRYVSAAAAADRQDCLDEVESACAGVATPRQLRTALYLVLTVGCMFYTLFLFDTLGDEVGFAGAFWVLIVVPLLPVVAWAVHTTVNLIRSNGTVRAFNSSKTDHSPDREMGVALADLQAMRAARVVAVEASSGSVIGEQGNGELSSENPMHVL
jgi:Leucine-rich repeat (LRR) protein